MNRRIDFTKLEGLGVSQDTFDFMQVSYREAIASLASMVGDLVIVTGCADLGATYGPGWVAINGELLPFPGGVKASNVIIEEVVTQEEFADGLNKDVYYVRTAKLAASGGNAFASFKRLRPLKDIDNALATATADILAEAAARAAADSSLNTLKAPLASPALTGVPTAPTAAGGTNTTQIATTAYVIAAINALIAAAPGALNTLDELAAALGDDPNYATTITNLLALKAPLASPALTGTPTAPTAAGGTNTTQVATTAFVIAAIVALIAGAPANLDTLDKIAAAINDDPNFHTTVTNALAGKLANSGASVHSGTIEVAGGLRSGNNGAYEKWTNPIAIGDWDMDTDAVAFVNHGIGDWKTIIGVEYIIRADNDLARFTSGLLHVSVSSTEVTLTRGLSSAFDQPGFSATSYNRGWIRVKYLTAAL